MCPKSSWYFCGHFCGHFVVTLLGHFWDTFRPDRDHDRISRPLRMKVDEPRDTIVVTIGPKSVPKVPKPSTTQVTTQVSQKYPNCLAV